MYYGNYLKELVFSSVADNYTILMHECSKISHLSFYFLFFRYCSSDIEIVFIMFDNERQGK